MKTTKRVTTMILVAILIVALSGVAYAATNYTLNGNYQTVFSRANGINGYVIIDVYNTNSRQHTDIRMLDFNGNVVWEEYGAIDYSSSRTFWCGSNVCQLQARVAGKDIIGDLSPKIASCNVYQP